KFLNKSAWCYYSLRNFVKRLIGRQEMADSIVTSEGLSEYDDGVNDKENLNAYDT
ncbi:16232_t:CDS:2, partial [Entrophospora sp. SA101]